MKKSIFVAVCIAAGFSTAAISAEVKKDTKAPVVKAQKMSDSDMDKVTAGNQSFHSSDVGFNSGVYYPSTYGSFVGSSASVHASVPLQGTVGIGKR